MNPWGNAGGGNGAYTYEQMLSRLTLDYWWRLVSDKMGIVFAMLATFLALALMLGVIARFFSIWGIDLGKWGKAVNAYRDEIEH